MNHITVRKKLIFYLEGSLRSDEDQLVIEHLAHCEGCREYGEELQQSMAVLNANRFAKPGDYFYAGIRTRIEARAKSGSVAYKQILQPAIIILMLALGIRFGIWVGEQAKGRVPMYEQVNLVPFDDLSEEPIEEFLLNIE